MLFYWAVPFVSCVLTASALLNCALITIISWSFALNGLCLYCAVSLNAIPRPNLCCLNDWSSPREICFSQKPFSWDKHTNISTHHSKTKPRMTTFKWDEDWKKAKNGKWDLRNILVSCTKFASVTWRKEKCSVVDISMKSTAVDMMLIFDIHCFNSVCVQPRRLPWNLK